MQNTHQLPFVYGGGYRVYTTLLDTELQRQAESTVANNFSKKRKEQVALISIDPTSGEVRALVGGEIFGNPSLIEQLKRCVSRALRSNH